MSPSYSPADWKWPCVCLCYLIPVESCYPASSVFWFISAPAHLLKAVNSQWSSIQSPWVLRESMDLWTILVLVCSEIVIMGKHLSCATVDLTSRTLSNMGKEPAWQQWMPHYLHFICTTLPPKVFSGVSPQAPSGAHVRGQCCITI